eukprot:CAMPEP_0172920606 /NCGR_PEP_ID=MMETSP1075-20121228/204392_1 /TAXON_ID=2916 /ORGANISM="Ceratium fusus, Strain PA161109" /LENGTH=31 /DNA_ID= /DNA_START= /DNA_END= /DNA_ORIENTATION=
MPFWGNGNDSAGKLVIEASSSGRPGEKPSSS